MMNAKSMFFCAGAALLAGLAFVACGDENTYITESGNGSMPVLKSGEKLSKQACDSTNVGDMLFVMDSSAAFLCNGEEWISQKGEKGDTGAAGTDGKDGKDGEDGTKGDKGDAGLAGDDGSSCTAMRIEQDERVGYVLTCGGEVVGTLWNGLDGMAGKDGLDGAKGDAGVAGDAGASCMARQVVKDNRSGYELTCGGAVVDTLWNGVDGAKGDKGEDGTKGDKGDDGSSCTAAKVMKDGLDGIEITCAGAVIDTLWNGEKGDKGEDGAKGDAGSSCVIAKDSAGVVTLVCGEGETADTTKVYKAMCGTTPYDPAKNFCDKGVIIDDRSEYDGSAKTLKDFRNGKTYKTVTIGSQIWMAENLNYAYPVGKFDYDGYISDSISWCYDNDLSNCDKYGRLYLWSAAMDSAALFSDAGKVCGYGKTCNPSGTIRGVCPSGWHLPSQSEWNTLFTAVGGSSTAGTKLKTQTGWNSYSGVPAGTDAYGFSALPAGRRSDSGYFNGEGGYAYLWSSAEIGSNLAYYVGLYYNLGDAYLTNSSKYNGYSVRCVKND